MVVRGISSPLREIAVDLLFPQHVGSGADVAFQFLLFQFRRERVHLATARFLGDAVDLSGQARRPGSRAR